MKKLLFSIIGICIFFVANANITSILSIQEDRNVPAFTKIELRIPASVTLKQDNPQKLSIDASSETLKLIETYVENKTLIIKFNKFNVNNPGDIKISISVATVEGLAISGSGNINCVGKLNVENLSLAISGSGDITFDDLTALNLKSSTSGSGDIKINGGKSIGSISIAISGSGNFKSIEVPANDINIKVSGSGDCFVYATGTLSAKTSGSGNIKYKGTPKIDVNISGSGKVISAE